MKCPTCDTKCSDLRDICPHCFQDLRETKKIAGLTITFPNLDFSALLKKYNLEKSYAAYTSQHPTEIPPEAKPAEYATDQELKTISSELQEVFTPEAKPIEEVFREEKPQEELPLEVSSPLEISAETQSTETVLQEVVTQEEILPEITQTVGTVVEPSPPQLPSPSLLFKSVAEDLKQYTTEEIDLTSVLSLTPKDKETARALFQVIDDELQGKLKHHAQDLASSDQRKVESEVLGQRLDEFEAAISNVSAAPKRLSELIEKQKDLIQKPAHAEEATTIPTSTVTTRKTASISRRVCACLIDWIVVLVLAWVCLIIYDTVTDKGYFVALVTQSYELIDWNRFIFHFCLAFFAVFPCYTLITYSVNRDTIGENWCGLVIHSANKVHSIGPKRLLLRAILVPLYVFLIPGVSRLFSDRTLVDWLSGTEIGLSQST